MVDFSDCHNENAYSGDRDHLNDLPYQAENGGYNVMARPDRVVIEEYGYGRYKSQARLAKLHKQARAKAREENNNPVDVAVAPVIQINESCVGAPIEGYYDTTGQFKLLPQLKPKDLRLKLNKKE